MKLNNKGIVELAVLYVVFGFIAAIGYAKNKYEQDQMKAQPVESVQAPVTEQYIVQRKKFKLVENSYQHQIVNKEKPSVQNPKPVCGDCPKR